MAAIVNENNMAIRGRKIARRDEALSAILRQLAANNDLEAVLGAITWNGSEHGAGPKWLRRKYLDGYTAPSARDAALAKLNDADRAALGIS